IEAFFQLLFAVAHINDAATGFFGELPHFPVAAIAHAKSAVESAVCDKQDVAHGVSFMSGFNRIIDTFTAALVLTICEHDHGFAPGFTGKLVIRREVNSIVEQRAPRIAHRYWAAPHAGNAATASARVDLCAIQRAA